MANYLQTTPAISCVILEEILTSFGMKVEEPDVQKIDEMLQTPSDIPMVAIPWVCSNSIVDEECRENETPVLSTVVPAAPPVVVSHEQVPPVLQIATDVPNSSERLESGVSISSAIMPETPFNEVELALLEQCSDIDEENMELAYLTCSLSLSMVEAEFLRMQLKLFNLKARSILELFQYCEGSNNGFCRCPEIRKRVYEMGILVQRADS
ncbi:uncharacterized protein LOC131685008 [Topomyia yanbarensis]|uniref:uncharacterized protein LOC131685008 n=1 Tax=Topomyia yanbarensis TaxID=2498891 RepID=UPI00273B7345|nr:uncharacterized protein LOC131685008 [Topomyia yanbarensis]